MQALGQQVAPGVLGVDEVEVGDVVDEAAVGLLGTFSSKQRLPASMW